MKLPNCDDLFLRFFDPWIDDELRKRRVYKSTRPDIETITEWKGLSPEEVVRLSKDVEAGVNSQIQSMVDAANEDWVEFLPVSHPVTLDWIDAFDKFYTKEKIAKVIGRSDPSDYSNEYLVLCCEFGAVMGKCLIDLKPSLSWLPDYPYWETPIFDTKTGSLINVFSWAVKKMSEYGVDDGYKAKAIRCLEVIEEN